VSPVIIVFHKPIPGQIRPVADSGILAASKRLPKTAVKTFVNWLLRRRAQHLMTNPMNSKLSENMAVNSGLVHCGHILKS
jgi:hypothetical protein